MGIFAERALIACPDGQKKVKAIWFDARYEKEKRQFGFVDNRRREKRFAFAREDNGTSGATLISILFSAARIQFFSHSFIIRLGIGTEAKP